MNKSLKLLIFIMEYSINLIKSAISVCDDAIADNENTVFDKETNKEAVNNAKKQMKIYSDMKYDYIKALKKLMV